MRAVTTGDRGFRHFLVDVVVPTRATPIRYRYRALPHHVWIPEDMEAELDKLIDDLDARFKDWNFRRVDVGANHFKFIYDGLREKPATPADPDFEMDKRMLLENIGLSSTEAKNSVAPVGNNPEVTA